MLDNSKAQSKTAPKTNQKKLLLLVAGAALLVAAAVLVYFRNQTPPPPEAAVVAEQALEQAYKTIEQEETQKQQRTLEFQGASSETLQPAKDPGGGLRVAPK